MSFTLQQLQVGQVISAVLSIMDPPILKMIENKSFYNNYKTKYKIYFS